MPDWSALRPRLDTFTILAGVSVCLVLVTTLSISMGALPGPCSDNLAVDGPVADFAISYNETTNTVTVRYIEGDTFTAVWTESIFVLVSAADNNATKRYRLISTASDFPVTPGDEVTIGNVTIAGRPITGGDILRITWYGSEQPLPAYCLNSRDGESINLTLAEHQVK